jgi:hypothetical protein
MFQFFIFTYVCFVLALWPEITASGLAPRSDYRHYGLCRFPWIIRTVNLLFSFFFVENESDLKTSTFPVESLFLLWCYWTGTSILLPQGPIHLSLS